MGTVTATGPSGQVSGGVSPPPTRVVAGGGATVLSGGTYRLGSTMGQATAGDLVGGSLGLRGEGEQQAVFTYRLRGGFWPSAAADGAAPLLPPTTGDNTCQTAAADTGIPCNIDADCTPPAACGNKSRYITITPGSAATAGGGNTSIQVEIVTMPQFAGRVGEVWWAGPETNLPNSPSPALRGALLVCQPTPGNAQVWTSGNLHLFGTAIVPGSTYNVRMCNPTGGNCSDPLLVATGKWGDAIRGFGGGSQPNFGDVNAIVQKFSNLASAPSMPRADLVGPGNPGSPNAPNQTANFADISADVSAFSGFQYPYTVPACP